MSAYLMVSLHSNTLNQALTPVSEQFLQHESWDGALGWKNLLNNLRLVIQPFVCFNLIKPWLKVFPIPQLSLGFPRLISIMNQFNYLGYLADFRADDHFSSA